MVKRIFSLNFLDAFVFGITTIIVPLLMLERGISVAAIGIVFALAPVAKIAVRLVSAAAADAFGERPFYFLNAAANFIQAPIYLFASGAGLFAAGKLVDGARESFIWAVNRTSVMHHAPDRGHFALGSLVSGRAAYFALGSLAAGLLFPLGGFGLVLSLAGAIGLAMLFLSTGTRNTPHRQRARLSDFTFLGRERRFYETLGALSCGGSFYTVILYFLVPLMLKLSGFSLWQIGIAYAAYFLVFALVLNVISHVKATGGAVAAAGVAIFAFCLLGMSFGGTQYLPYFFVFMAVGDGCLALLWEEINYLQARLSSRRSTEIALLNTPPNVATLVISAASGFAVESFGFAPILLLGAASMAAFAAWSVRLSGMKS